MQEIKKKKKEEEFIRKNASDNVALRYNKEKHGSIIIHVTGKRFLRTST